MMIAAAKPAAFFRVGRRSSFFFRAKDVKMMVLEMRDVHETERN